MGGMAIDIILVLLLGVTMFFGLRLSRQFSEIRNDQDRLAKLVDSLNVASGRAEKAVQSMKKAALETGEQLQGRIGKGQALSEELEIMIEAGDSLAERLSKLAESSRKAVNATSGHLAAPPKPAKTAPPPKGSSRAEEELKAALAGKRDKT